MLPGCIGRDAEMEKIRKLLSDKISVVLTGAAGIGKTALLQHVPSPLPELNMADVTGLKKSLLSVFFQLESPETCRLHACFPEAISREKLLARLNKESLPDLCKLLCQLTPRHGYLLRIGTLDGMTVASVRALEILSPHFVIFTTTREIKLKNTSFLWHFEKIILCPLSRHHTAIIARLHLASLFAKAAPGSLDEVLLLSRIRSISEGNPKMIIELCERFSEETDCQPATLERLLAGYLGRQTKETDLSLAVLVVLGAMTLFRFAAGEVGNPSLRFIGGIFLVVLLVARPFFNTFKRKNL